MDYSFPRRAEEEPWSCFIQYSAITAALVHELKSPTLLEKKGIKYQKVYVSVVTTVRSVEVCVLSSIV